MIYTFNQTFLLFQIEPLAKARALFHKCVSFASGKDRGGKEGVIRRKYHEFLFVTALTPTLFDQRAVQEQEWPSPTSLGRAISMLAADGAGSLLSPQVVAETKSEGVGMNTRYRAVYRLRLAAMQLSFPTTHYSKSAFSDDLLPKLVEISLELFASEIGVKVDVAAISRARERIVHFETTMMHHISPSGNVVSRETIAFGLTTRKLGSKSSLPK